MGKYGIGYRKDTMKSSRKKDGGKFLNPKRGKNQTKQTQKLGIVQMFEILEKNNLKL